MKTIIKIHTDYFNNKYIKLLNQVIKTITK